MANAAHKKTDGDKKGEPAEIERLVGPIGSIALMVGLPFLQQFMWYSCAHHQCSEISTLTAFSKLPWDQVLRELFPSPNAFSLQITAAWFTLQYLLFVVIPGYNFLGYPLPDGGRLYYKVNGLACWILTIVGGVGGWYLGYIPESFLSEIYVNFGRIIWTFQLTAISLSFILYAKGRLFHPPTHASGNIIIDYFFGYEMNPRFFNAVVTDVKWFVEGRALILWTVISFFLMHRQYVVYGTVTNAMGLTVLFHFWYVGHYFVYETNVLAMIDFTGENLGWMLTWGNIMVCPFLYTGPEWYLVSHTHTLSTPVFLLIAGLYFSGYVMFSQANRQKQQFRNDPTKPIWGKEPRVLVTSAGRKLLLSGWWGIGRHMNYTGDLMQAWAYGMPCLAIGLAPCINGGFLTYLLLHREGRDNRWCESKYGKDWKEYCKLVPYRLIPYVY